MTSDCPDEAAMWSGVHEPAYSSRGSEAKGRPPWP